MYNVFKMNKKSFLGFRYKGRSGPRENYALRSRKDKSLGDFIVSQAFCYETGASSLRGDGAL